MSKDKVYLHRARRAILSPGQYVAINFHTEAIGSNTIVVSSRFSAVEGAPGKSIREAAIDYIAVAKMRFA
jgi:hypothetical protein